MPRCSPTPSSGLPQITLAHWPQVRAGERVDNSQLIKFAKLFNDELTLDNLERVHLVNLCRFVGITPFGTDEFLRSRLRARLSAIKARGFPVIYTLDPELVSPFRQHNALRHRRVYALPPPRPPVCHQGTRSLLMGLNLDPILKP